MWYYTPVGGAIWGTAWAAYNPPWYVDAAIGAGIGFAVTSKTGGAITRGTLFQTGKVASKGASWIARTNVARTAGMGLLRGSAAVAVPVAAGYATSYAIAGKSGAGDFHDYITGGVSPKEYWDTVTLKSMR